MNVEYSVLAHRLGRWLETLPSMVVAVEASQLAWTLSLSVVPVMVVVDLGNSERISCYSSSSSLRESCWTKKKVGHQRASPFLAPQVANAWLLLHATELTSPQPPSATFRL